MKNRVLWKNVHLSASLISVSNIENLTCIQLCRCSARHENRDRNERHNAHAHAVAEGHEARMTVATACDGALVLDITGHQ